MSYGWLNIVKGDYPSINMPTFDAVLTKVAGKEVVRGSVIIMTGNKSGKIAESELLTGDHLMAYWALQGEDNPEAVEAGSVTNPKVVGLPCTMSMEVETDQYVVEDGGSAVTYNVGDLLTAKDGKVLPVSVSSIASSSKVCVIGIVSQAPSERWLNDKPVNHSTGYRQGTMAPVIRFVTTYDPEYVKP